MEGHLCAGSQYSTNLLNDMVAQCKFYIHEPECLSKTLSNYLVLTQCSEQ